MASRFLRIYLQDHMAGATSGSALAQRILGSNRGHRTGAVLEHVAREIEVDRDTLARLMASLQVPPSRLKNGLAWVAEKAGRLKLNGSLFSYSPLSRLVELETLMLGVSGKLALWQALKETGAAGERQPDLDLDALIARAEDQRRRLDEARLNAAREALRP